MELQLFVLHFRYYGPLFVILIGLVITYLYIVYSLYRKVSFQTSKIFENEEYIVLMCINCLSSTCNTGISLPGVSEVMGSTLRSNQRLSSSRTGYIGVRTKFGQAQSLKDISR